VTASLVFLWRATNVDYNNKDNNNKVFDNTIMVITKLPYPKFLSSVQFSLVQSQFYSSVSRYLASIVSVPSVSVYE